MGFFVGSVLLGAVIWYVGRKIARVLFAIGVMIETIGKQSHPDWPADEEFRRAFKE